MAFKNKNNNYIKLEKTGEYKIYLNEEQRLREKNAHSSEEILNSFREMLTDLYSDGERSYYDSVKWEKEVFEMDKEYNLYIYCLKTGPQPNMSFPIMEYYYPDIYDTIPTIIQQGGVNILKGETEKESYLKAKNLKIWKDIEDC